MPSAALISRSSDTRFNSRLQAAILGLQVSALLAYFGGLGVILYPLIWAVTGNTQSGSRFSNTVTSVYHLLDGFDLEFLDISHSAHAPLLSTLTIRPEGLYETRGDSVEILARMPGSN